MLPRPLRGAFEDRVQDERLARRRGRDFLADPHVEVRADPADRLDRGERVADDALRGEQFATLHLFGVQVHPAGPLAGLVVGVVREHERGHDQAEGERQHDGERDQALAGLRFGRRRSLRRTVGAHLGGDNIVCRGCERSPETVDESLLTFRLAQAAALPWMWRVPMTYLLRRLPLSRLLLLCGLVVVIGISVTALAFALGTGPTPPPKPLADAVHDALTGAAGTSPRRQRERPADRPPARRRQPHQRRQWQRGWSAHVQPAGNRRLRPAVDLQGRPCAPGTAVRKGRHPDLLRRAHRLDVRRFVEHALPLHGSRP